MGARLKVDLFAGRRWNRGMNLRPTYSLILVLPLLLAGCTGMPKLFWDIDEGKKSTPTASGAASTSGDSTSGQSARRSLEVPPELQGKVELPTDATASQESGDSTPGTIATVQPAAQAPVKARVVNANSRDYSIGTEPLFAVAVDAISARKLPLQSVDGASGTITTDWAYSDSDSAIADSVLGLFGAASSKYRYRLVARIRALDGAQSARLTFNVLGQRLDSGRWVNRSLDNKLIDALFKSVEKNLNGEQPRP